MPLKCPDCGGECYGKPQDHETCSLSSDGTGKGVYAGEHCECRGCGKEHESQGLM